MKSILGVAAVVIVAGLLIYGARGTNFGSGPNSTSTPQTSTTTDQTSIQSYGDVTLKFGETAKFKDIQIKPIELVEDSRCPSDVQCIQAGTVRIKLEIKVTNVGTQVIGLNKPITWANQRITLVAVNPGKVSTQTVSPSEYVFQINVVPKTPETSPNPPISAACFVGGCSGQICSDDEHVVSTCEYRPEYSCYKEATCERQTNGSCGWTQTNTLKMCLQNSASANIQLPS